MTKYFSVIVLFDEDAETAVVFGISLHCTYMHIEQCHPMWV